MIPEQTEAQTILTIIGAVLCLGGWFLIYLGTRVAGLSAGLAGGLVLGQILVGLFGVEQETSGWWIIACALLGAGIGLVVMMAATRLVFAITGLLLGALIGDGLYLGYGTERLPRLQPVVAMARIGGSGSAGQKSATPSELPKDWPPQRMQSVGMGAILGLGVGLLAQNLLIIGLTAYFGAALIQASFPPLQDRPEALLYLIFGSVVIQAGLAGRFVRGIFSGRGHGAK
jgi:hypothetical protein